MTRSPVRLTPDASEPALRLSAAAMHALHCYEESLDLPRQAGSIAYTLLGSPDGAYSHDPALSDNAAPISPETLLAARHLLATVRTILPTGYMASRCLVSVIPGRRKIWNREPGPTRYLVIATPE